MIQTPLRLVHASDFHLERPLGGIAEVPDHLREVFLEAPFEAARKVFETVLSEGADALLLAGDIVDFDLAGPRAIVFLREQFQRLAAHEIPVYWACGSADPADSWPASVELPANVHVFPVGQVTDFELRRGGATVGRIQGISHSPGMSLADAGFCRDPQGLFTVGVFYDSAAASNTVGDHVDYLALGGQHQRQTINQPPGLAHYAGSPQGRRPHETGPYGCTLVSVDEAGHTKTRRVATDQIRWIREAIEITAGTDEDALLTQMQARISKLRTQHVGSPLLVTWEVTGRGQVLNHLRSGGISDLMVQRLRDQYGQQSPGVWTVEIACHAPLDVPQEWVDEETILGDLLREFQTLEADGEADLKLQEFLPAGLAGETWDELATVPESQRADLLWAASKIAVDLLDGEEELRV